MIEIIGAGLPRTGTSSLKRALETLGFGPCHHMEELLLRPEQVGRWRQALTGEQVDWGWVCEGYRSVTDWPGAFVALDLAKAFPEAKVVLTIRDKHAWYASLTETIHPFIRGEDAADLALSGIQQLSRLMWADAFGDVFGGVPDEEEMIAAFEQHTFDIMSGLPADRVLAYQVRDGWKPLCDFLGVPVPADTPFPYLNTRAQATSAIEAARS